MSAYVPGGSGAASGPFANTSGGVNYRPTGGGGTGDVYEPTASGGGSGEPGGSAAPAPGVVSINPLDPGASGQQAADATHGLLDGLASALFGPHQGILTGGLTGAIADDQGVIGQAGRAIGGVPGGIGDTLKNAADIVGGGLERLPAGNTHVLDARMSDPAMKQWLAERSDPNDPASPTNAEKFAGDKGIAGTGLLSNEDHYKTMALKAFDESQQAKHPGLLNGKFETPGSLADTVGYLMDGFGLFGTAYNRTLAGIHDRAEEARQIGQGTAVSTGFLGTGFMAGEKGATPGEQLVAKKLNDGSWTKDQALDFLVASGQTAHDATLSVALAAATPDIAFSFGAGLAVKGALKGAEAVAAADRAGSLLEEANAAQRAAEAASEAASATRAGRAAIKVGETTRPMRLAEKAVQAAKDTVAERQAAVESFKGYRTGDTINRANLIDRAFQGSEQAQRFVSAFGRAYTGLEGTYLGRAAKLTRYLIDPMHGIDLHMPGNARMVDLYADSLTETLHNTMNPIEGLKNFNMMRDIDKTGVLADRYARALATGMTNRGREGLLSMHQASAIDRGLAGELQTAEGALRRDDVIADASKHVREKDLLGWLREDIVRNVARQDAHWTKAAHEELAQKLESVFGIRSKEEWLAELPKMSKERKSLLDFSLYAESNKSLLEAVSHAKADLHPSAAEFDLDRTVLLSTKTLTRVGADSLLSKLGKVANARGSEKKSLAIIQEWQTKYPELAYIVMDSGNPGKSIKRFINYVEGHLESFPMQFKNDELAKMTDEMKNLSENLGSGYQLGFRPREEFLWGIERSNEAGGGFIGKTVPWADHVAEGGRGYRPGIELPKNIAGMPLIGTPLTKAARSVDYMAAGANMLAQQVTGQQIHEVARQRFISIASNSTYKGHGLNEATASKWWDRLQEYTREHQGYSGPRGFGKGDLYGAIANEGLIPSTMLNGSMRLTENDVLRFVLQAYDGDMRFIGLTQKLSGRVKTMLSAMTGYNSNFAGQVAEHAWPMMKFRYNPIFQLQEKIEPWVLNAQRGISSPFVKPTMNEADRLTESLLGRMTESSLIRQADLDQAEYVQLLNFDKRMKSIAGDPTTRMSRMASAAGQIMDVQGVKRIGALRTFRKGMGKELRGAWDETMPGVWQEMKTNADAMAGRVLDEDEFAVQVMAENLFANDINLGSRFEKAGKAAGVKLGDDWENSIKTGEWLRPSHVGELRSLDLDHVARGMQSFADGSKVASMADLRRVIASADKPEKAIGEVSDFLRRLGADKDYVGRVENSLTFSWTGFWKEAEKRYNLTFAESKRLQDFMSAAGEVRGMNPTDFMSQVFDPGIIDGTEGLLGSLDKPLGVIRKNPLGETVGRGRSRLAAPKDASAKREDLVKQISAVFSQHLDPSAKRALLMEFKPELLKSVKSGKVRLDMHDVKAMWDSDAEDQLANRILGYMDGKYGTADHKVIDDAAQGIATVRDGANKYLREHGVTPMDERRYYKTDDVHYQQVADEYGALPETEYEKTGRRPTTKQVYAADSDLKPQPAGVDDRTYKAYQQFVHETQDQFAFMTKPKKEGGMGIKVVVAKGDPYTYDDAGRAAMARDIKKGELRVLGQQSDHPLMTNEQNVQFRAVHDVFGHSAEGFEFGPRGEMNAAAQHFRMYGPEARGPLLTETHGQTAYVNFSNDVIPGSVEHVPLEASDPALDFEARNPFEGSKTPMGGPDDPLDEFRSVNLKGDTGTLRYFYTQRTGAGLRALKPELQAHLLQPLQDLMDEFPGLKVHHVDVVDFEAPLDAYDDNMLTGLGTTSMSPFAVTFGAGQDGPVVIFNSKFVTDEGHIEDWAMLHKHNEAMKNYDTFYKPTPKGPVDLPRDSAFGTPYNAVGPDEQFTLQTVMRHEAGHAFDVERRPQHLVGTKWVQKPLPGQETYHDMMTRFENEAGRLHLSEYGMQSGVEFAAELFAFATNPRLDLAKVRAAVPGLADMTEEFQKYLKDVGEWKPAVTGEFAGKTVREANAAKRGSVYAPQKAGLLPQSTIDDFAQRYVGVGKHVESNPDVARVAQHFGAWSQKVMQNGLTDGENAVHAGLLNDVAKMPIDSAAPYNYTEAMAHQVAVSKMQAKWQDAYRLQYFKQSRSMLERSINHPMFGIYPASYMWGKLMPEVVQFIAQRPFGIRTGGALSASVHAEASIALRREYDPEFDAAIEKMGHSQALSFAGYMLPTLPWDITASAPAWMKDVAGQGLDNNALIAQGQAPKDFNAVQPATDVIGKLNPLETTIPWAGKAIDAANGANTPQEKLQAALEDAQHGQVKAAELGTPLYYVMQELQAELAK